MIKKSGRTDAQNIQPIRANGCFGTNLIKRRGMRFRCARVRTHTRTRTSKLNKPTHTHFEENWTQYKNSLRGKDSTRGQVNASLK